MVVEGPFLSQGVDLMAFFDICGGDGVVVLGDLLQLLFLVLEFLEDLFLVLVLGPVADLILILDFTEVLLQFLFLHLSVFEFFPEFYGD